MKHQQITSFETACTKLGIDPTHLPDVSRLPQIHQNSITSYYKLVIIAEAINDGWQPNWHDDDQPKYFPWFEVEATEENTAGVGFSDAHYGDWYANTHVSSRLCFPSSELARYAGTQFQDLYKSYLLIGQ